VALLAVGRVARAHGIRGRVMVAPYNHASQGLERVTALWLGERRFEVERAERVHKGYLVALRGIETRDAADALRGAEVRADRSELPALEGGERYLADLLGLVVVDRGVERGKVVGIEGAGGNDLLELDTGALVPLAFVKEVEGDRIAVETPEGLFDLPAASRKP